MRNLRQGPIPSDIGDLIDELDSINDRLRTLEAPGGEALYSTVKKLQGLVEDIQDQLDSYMASRYTNAQIDSLVNGRALASHTHDQGQVTGTWTKGVSTGDPVYFVNAYNTDITGTRRTAWLQNDGRLGYASSSAERKAAIRLADIDVQGILGLAPRTFYYRNEVKRRTTLRINEGVDYRPAREVGLLAHEVDEVAPWLVYHDAEGEPEGVEYAMLPVALLAVMRDQERRLRALEGNAG